MSTPKTYGSITFRDNAWHITSQPDVAIRIKRLLPRVRTTSLGTIVVEDTADVAMDIEWLLGRWPMEMARPDRDRLTQGADSYRGRGERVHGILTGTATHQDMPLEPAEAMTPRPYQRQAHDLARATGALLLADELGLGKTLVGLLPLSDPTMRPMLAVTLTGTLPRQWCRELDKTFPDLTAHEVTKRTPYDMTDKDGRTPDLIVMNYAKLSGWAHHLKGVVKSVVFDEVQELRRTGTDKHNAACMVAHDADLVQGLSATPVYNYGGEMFSIMSVLAPGLVGSKEEFGREWCKSTYGLDAKTSITEPAALRQWMTDQGVFLRRTRDDVGIELPDISLIEHFVDYDEQAWNAASGDAMEIARLLVDPSTPHRQRWSASGDFDWRMRKATGVAKAPFVADFTRLVLESEEKVILAGWHRDVWDIWQERLADLNPVLFTGTESPAQKNRAFDSFMGGDSRVLLLSLRSGAGLDGFQGVASNVIFGELDWSPGVHKQIMGRLHRPGQTRPVFGYFCVSDQGGDPAMRDVLNVKQMEAEMLINPEALVGAQKAPDMSGHIRRLAESILHSHGKAA